jgi:hypothetical protein
MWKPHRYGNHTDMEIKKQTCPNCGTENAIGQCGSCGRPFVLSEAFPQGRARQLGDGPLSEVPDDLSPGPCDYCRLKQEGEMMEATSAGRRQRTCPVCHADCLSGLGP